MNRVEIRGGIVTGATMADSKGTHPLLADLGSWRFFVEAVEPDGGRIGMWDGTSYDEAILEAAALSADFGPVVDLVVSAGSTDQAGALK